MRTEPPETVSLLAKKLGVSLRTLELGFREHRQSTPKQFLRQMRLDAARAQLQASSFSTTVTSVALANGFPHLARFSVAYYREAFGKYPSQTLARSRNSSSIIGFGSTRSVWPITTCCAAVADDRYRVKLRCGAVAVG